MTTGIIAITGATGFVGTQLVEHLRDTGQTLRLLVRNADAAHHRDMDLVEGDLASKEALAALCQDASIVVHCAGKISACSRAEFDEVNADGTGRVVEAARNAEVGRFIHISSLAAREPDVSDYAASKRAGEEIVQALGDEREWVILRPPAVYGPGDRATLPLIRQLTRRVALVPGSRLGRASLIHVRDLASAIAHVVVNRGLSGGVYELDDGKQDGYSWRELSRVVGDAEGHRVNCVFLPKSALKLAGVVELALAKRAGRMPEVTPGKVQELYHPDWVCRYNMLQEHSGWAPAVLLEDGLKETTAWYRQHGWL